MIPIALWSAVECAVGVLAANLATYRPLFCSLVDTVTRLGTGPGGRYSSSRFAAWSLGRRTREHGYVMNGNRHDLGSAEPQATSIVSAGLAFPDVRGTSDEELGILKQAEVDVTGHGERRSRARKGKRITGDRADGPQ